LSEGVVESPAELVARIQQLLLDSSEAAVRED
jgi:hypothetical protein